MALGALGLGALGLGASLLGGGFGSKQGSTSTTSTSEPWKPAQPYITDVMRLGQNLYNQNYTSPYTTQAQNLTAQRALSGSPLTQAGSSQLMNTINGNYLDPYSNPYFSGALNQTLGDVKSQINSQFQGDNFGSSAHQEWLGRGLTNAALPLLANQYNTERGNQISALGMAPNYANQDYTDLAALSGVGQEQQNTPWNNLFKYQQAISGFGGLGGTTTQQNPYYVNNTANTLGSASSLAAIGNLLGLFG